MSDSKRDPITVEVTIKAPIQKVWNMWNEPNHITKWCFASEDWHAPSAVNDLKVGGKSTTTMAAKDGSVSFDFSWVYTRINNYELLEYTLEDDRKVSVKFETTENGVRVIETFDPEEINPVEMQRQGWQGILDNFKKYVEAN